MNTEELKKRSGAKKFASILGKSNVSSDSEEYRFVEEVVRHLLRNEFGILHGGYAGGVMSAASEAASVYLQERGLPPERNIGVPQRQHETLWPRVDGAVFSDVTHDLFDRLRDVVSGDVTIFAPVGGDGTEAEVAVVFHSNVTRLSLGQEPIPMVFLETPSGTPWRQLLEVKTQLLATSIKDIDSAGWMYFVRSVEEFDLLLQRLC